MTSARWLPIAALVAALATPATRAQDLPKPGPEHAQLKKLEGVWDATISMHGQESKGTMKYSMDLNGLWLLSHFEGEFGGMKFTGMGADSYDAAKKKYTSVWIDTMSTSPLVMEGTYDKEKKTLTMTGEGPGMDGKPTKYRTTTTIPDDNNAVFKMFGGDSKEPVFTITYKRKK